MRTYKSTIVIFSEDTDLKYFCFYSCGNNAFPTPAWRDAVEFWFNWANTVSVNRDVRLLIGAPGSVAAASDVSFVPLDDPNGTANTPTLKNIIDIWKRDFGSRFGKLYMCFA